MDWITEQGRIPEFDELENAPEIIEIFGSLKHAFTIIKRVTGQENWEAIRKTRREDLLVYFALANFHKRPRFSQLPPALQKDVRAFFGTYKSACEQSDAILFETGSPDAVDAACKQSAIGKLLPNAIYLHRDALDFLAPLLRIYEGCARTFIGDIESANIIKLHRFSGKVSYLVYPEFDKNPHPTLLRSIKVNLPQLRINSYDYTASKNPPILHRKELFLPRDHPLFERFARLSRQEDKHELLAEGNKIGTLKGWNDKLSECGFKLVGHRLIRRKPEISAAH